MNFLEQNFLIPLYRKGRLPVRGLYHPGVGYLLQHRNPDAGKDESLDPMRSGRQIAREARLP